MKSNNQKPDMCPNKKCLVNGHILIIYKNNPRMYTIEASQRCDFHAEDRRKSRSYTIAAPT